MYKPQNIDYPWYDKTVRLSVVNKMPQEGPFAFFSYFVCFSTHSTH